MKQIEGEPLRQLTMASSQFTPTDNEVEYGLGIGQVRLE